MRRGPCVFVSVEAGRSPDAEKKVRGSPGGSRATSRCVSVAPACGGSTPYPSSRRVRVTARQSSGSITEAAQFLEHSDQRQPLARRLRLKVAATGKNSAKIEVDHADGAVGTIALMRAIGTTDADFYDGLIRRLLDASQERGEPSESSANFMLSVVKGIEPRDQIEAMLAAQMAAVHVASMTFARRLAHVENIPQHDSASNAFNKLVRTFDAQMTALKDTRRNN